MAEHTLLPVHFLRAFDSLGIRVPHSEVNDIFTYLDRDLIGRIKWSEIIDAMFNGADFVSPRGGSDVRTSSSRRSAKNLIKIALAKRVDLSEQLLDAIKFVSPDKTEAMDKIYKEFKRADYDDTGGIGKSEFLRCLKKCGVTLKPTVERDLIDTIADETKSQHIMYRDFIDALTTEARSDDIVDDILTRMRKKLSREEKHGHDIEQIFTEMDKDNSGDIDIDELDTAMKKLGIPLTRDEAKRIMARFSTNGSTFRFKEFIRAFNLVTGDEDPNMMLERVIARIRHAIDDRLGTGTTAARKLKMLFETMDRDQNNSISQREFKEMMRKFKVCSLF